MKKLLFLFMLSAFIPGIYAATLPMVGLTPDGSPVGWRYNSWGGYHPMPATTLKDGILQLSDSKSAEGFGFISMKKHSAKPGDQVTVKFNARGKGTIFWRLHVWNTKGKWLGMISEQTFTLTEDWRESVAIMEIGKIGENEPAFYSLEFGGRKNAEFAIRNITESIQTGASAALSGIPDRIVMRKILFSEEFENSAHSANPAIEKRDTAPGLLLKTNVGVFTGPVKLYEGTIRLPDAKSLAAWNIRFYELSPGSELALRINQLTVTFRPLGNGLEAVLADRSQKLRVLEIPAHDLPCDFFLFQTRIAV